jgi:predicted transcriptional regulator
MKQKTRPPGTPTNVLRAISATRWAIYEVLQRRGPMPTDYIAKAIGASAANASKQLVALRKAGLLDHHMGRLYAIPERFLVPGERAVDFGPVVLRFDQPEKTA